jgi:biotin transport system substrate-specific component
VMEQTRNLPVGWAAGIAAAIGGILVLYSFGMIGFMMMLQKSFSEAFVVLGWYIPGDVIKVVLAGLITAALARARPASVLSRL